MSERWARAALQSYRYFGMAAYPFMGMYVAVRAARGKEQHERRGERYGKSDVARPAGPLVWVHAVSVGETGAVFEMVRRLRDDGLQVVLTTGTVTSAKLAGERLPDGVIHQYVPLDLKPAVSRFLNHWKPDLAIFAESEIWPMTILELGARRVPQVLINGRMSDRSFQRWQRRLALAESLFENFSHVAARSEVDAERFSALGARPVSITGNLKVDVPLPAVEDTELLRVVGAVGERTTWAAISTHEGEELSAIKCHIALKKAFPNLLTIIVPRHPTRGDQIAKLATESGLKVSLRTRDEVPAADADIFIGDTIGEMGLYLRLTQISFVGRSLAKTEGGQNPLEPAMLNCAILTGPKVANFQDVYDRLVEANGARIVEDERQLVKAVYLLLQNPKACRAMNRNAINVVNDMQGALRETIRVLDPYINPLIVQASLAPSETTDTTPTDDQANGRTRMRRSTIGW